MTLESDRRKTFNLTDEQVQHIAERAAVIAVERMTREVYHAVGKTILHKLAWAIGAAAVGVVVYASSKGWIR